MVKVKRKKEIVAKSARKAEAANGSEVRVAAKGVVRGLRNVAREALKVVPLRRAGVHAEGDRRRATGGSCRGVEQEGEVVVPAAARLLV